MKEDQASEVEVLRAKLNRVRALHWPRREQVRTCSPVMEDFVRCNCGARHPCATTLALEELS